MVERGRTERVLVGHFFRRFFDSDTLQVEGETLTTVVRAIAIVAAPGLMAAFFLQNQYPRRSMWGALEDHYFFVLFSFLVMAAVTVFEWEMLFPDRWDFLILSPLPIRPLRLLAAKAAALAGFLVLFLVSSSLFGTIILPAVSKGTFYRQFFAHSVAVLLAGLFASLCTLALGGMLLCTLGGRRFRLISPYIQAIAVGALLLLLVHYLRYGDAMQVLLTERFNTARWMPTMWFLGIYERVLMGDAAPAFAFPMARMAVRGTLTAGALVLVTYPLAWAKMRSLAIEGNSESRRRETGWLSKLLYSLMRSQAQRGVFVFIGQTLSRNNQYQVYLAMYLGVGLGFAVACAVTFPATGHGAGFGVSNEGQHALMAMLLFWVIVGFRAAFAFPLSLSSGWIFRISAVSVSECATAARRWVLMCAGSMTLLILLALAFAGWSLRALGVQAVCGMCLSVLLVDAFFAFYRSVPFNKARMPGSTSLPLVLTLYVGIFPLFILGMTRLEMQWEVHPAKLIYLAVGTALVHVGIGRLRVGPDEVEEEMQGYEGEFQLLGLS